MELLCVIFTVLITLSYSQIAYPEEDPATPAQNADGRQPVYIPGLCPVNQWYWPGDQQSDWICDCASRYVYYPPSDTCHELYRQGPCPVKEYLVLPKGKIIPECVKNPCMNDTMVPYNGKCHRLYKTDGCPPLTMGGGMLNVNHTSLELECLPANAAELNIIQVRNTPCPSGSKRSATGQCRVIAG